MKHFDIVIVGCGFAGAATAYHLSRASSRSVLVIDKEKTPGYHASGRNAALVLQSVSQSEIRRLTVASRLTYQRLADRIGFAQVGSVLLGAKESLAACRDPDLVESHYRNPAETQSRLPVLAGHRLELALETPSDGVMDIAALLSFYLEAARDRGVEFWLDFELLAVEARRPFRLITSHQVIESDCLINAGGAWATRIAELAGAAQLPLTPLKRHLFVLDGGPDLPERAPYVWSLDRQFYLRPESGGMLFCICDETPSGSLEPIVEPEITTRLAETVLRELPTMSRATLRRAWSCIRTKTSDELPVVGPDPGLAGFYWVAGLGGHGMATSWEVGRLAAQGITRDSAPPAAFDPARFSEDQRADPQ